MPQLSVNLNKVALIRNSRESGLPSLEHFARIAAAAGAHGITVHPRPDQRHIRITDILPLRAITSELGIEFNIEGNPFAPPLLPNAPGFMQLVESVRPDQCTLVPDSSDQLTSDHGFDFDRDGGKLKPLVNRLKDLGIRVSLFCDPDPQHMPAAGMTGADRVELFTGAYATAHARGDASSVLRRYCETAKTATAMGLGINAGHDLNLDNLAGFVGAVRELQEVSIGHALIADALEMGLAAAVRSYLELTTGNRPAGKSFPDPVTV